MSVNPDSRVFQLSNDYEFEVVAVQVNDAPVSLGVFLDGVDVTQQVSISTGSETRVDANQDLLLEDYEGHFTVDFLSYPLTPGTVVRIDAGMPHPGGTIEGSAAVTVERNAAIHTSRIIPLDEDSLEIGIELERIAFSYDALTIEHNGVDVTGLVTRGATTAVYDDTVGGVTRMRTAGTSLDISALTLVRGDSLLVTYTATASGGLSVSSAAPSVVGAGKVKYDDLSECQKGALQALALAMSGAATGQDAANAASAYKRSCPSDGGPINGSVQFEMPDGAKVIIEVGGSGEASSLSSTTSDLVIAIGGDATGSGEGGDATAKASKRGAKAVAIAGDGGNGESPGGGGDVVSSTAGGPNAAALSVSGTGGKPTDPVKNGGSGGSGAAKCPPQGTQGSDANDMPGEQGYGHGGVWAYLTPISGGLGYLPNN